jgi:small subunit ribosomal protein S7
MRHKKAEKRIVEPDNIYKNVLVTKFINRMMMDGKKTIAERNFYNALKHLETKELNPIETFEKALQQVGPKIEVKARRVGGANYQVPQEVRAERRVSLAIRWVIEAARKRPNKEFHTFAEKLAQELLDANNNLGEAIRKKDVMQKNADANKAFASFRF